MADYYTEKVVATLPGTLTANCVYWVRTGLGLVPYVTDNTGAIAHAVNQAITIPFFCRFNIRQNGTWRGPNPNNGPYTNNWNTTFGNNATTPAVNSDDVGFFVQAGDLLTKIKMHLRANNNEVVDFSFQLWHNDIATQTQLTAQTVTLTGTTPTTWEVDLNIAIPTDGVIVPVSRELTAVSANRLVYANGSFETQRLIQ